MKPTRILTPYSEEQAQRVAQIIGPLSADARALAELKRRRGLGEDVSLYLDQDRSILVGPAMPPAEERTPE